ncbi:unnamed protein product [Linum trigynum]|uniref:Uncharacterized protein n=1 Tax=Linum trigynum TaxID=586398 RepID=A0AAV2E0X9_9ROSI
MRGSGRCRACSREIRVSSGASRNCCAAVSRETPARSCLRGGGGIGLPTMRAVCSLCHHESKGRSAIDVGPAFLSYYEKIVAAATCLPRGQLVSDVPGCCNSLLRQVLA